MFDSIEELQKKIRLGEDSTFELKAVFFKGARIVGPKRGDLADEFAALANTNDGVCILGVDDKSREATGIPLEKLDSLESFVREICNDLIKPPLNARIVRLELPDSKQTPKPIIKIDIPRSLFVHKSPGGYFRRLGSSKREMTPEQLARLFQQRSHTRFLSFDEQTVPGAEANDLDESLWRRFAALGSEAPAVTLRKLKLLTEDESGIERPTIAGVLMCSWHPEKWLPNAYIEAVRYRGERQDSNHQTDAARISGPLDQQITHAMAFFRRNMRVAAVKTPARKEFPQFSEKAVFEAVANAVAHRDYSIHGSKIRLFMFDDRLELYSPGALPNTVTIESLSLRQATRNELLTSLLSRCAIASENHGFTDRLYLMEKRGDGVPIILNESFAISERYPKYRLIDDSELLLTIFSAKLPNFNMGN